MTKDPYDFGRRPLLTPEEQERHANRCAAIICATMSMFCLGGAFGFDQPVLGLASFIFLVTAVIVACEA